jgi:hypothetical protein
VLRGGLEEFAQQHQVPEGSLDLQPTGAECGCRVECASCHLYQVVAGHREPDVGRGVLGLGDVDEPSARQVGADDGVEVADRGGEGAIGDLGRVRVDPIRDAVQGADAVIEAGHAATLSPCDFGSVGPKGRGSMAAFDALRGYAQLAGGLTDVTRARAVAQAKAMIAAVDQWQESNGQARQAKEATAAARARVQGLADELMASSKANRALLTALVRSEAERAVSRLGVASMDDVDDLRREVHRIEKQLRAEGSTTGSRSHSTAAKKTATKATAKKTAAKKTAPRTHTKTSGDA